MESGRRVVLTNMGYLHIGLSWVIFTAGGAGRLATEAKAACVPAAGCDFPPH
jgi:hypothetical protein